MTPIPAPAGGPPWTPFYAADYSKQCSAQARGPLLRFSLNGYSPPQSVRSSPTRSGGVPRHESPRSLCLVRPGRFSQESGIPEGRRTSVPDRGKRQPLRIRPRPGPPPACSCTAHGDLEPGEGGFLEEGGGQRSCPLPLRILLPSPRRAVHSGGGAGMGVGEATHLAGADQGRGSLAVV